MVDACMKLALAIICLFATSSVEISPKDVDSIRADSQTVIVVMYFVPIVVCTSLLIHAIYLKRARQHSFLYRLKFAHRFRDVMALACNMSNKNFNKLITLELCDHDRHTVMESLDVLIAAVLKVQPGDPRVTRRFIPNKRRIIPNKPYQVGTDDVIDMALAERHIESPNLKMQAVLAHVVTALAQHAQSKIDDRPSSRRLSMKSVNFEEGKLEGIPYKDIFQGLSPDKKGSVSREEFIKSLMNSEAHLELSESERKMSEEQFGEAFDIIDVDGSGSIQFDEFCVALQWSEQIIGDQVKAKNQLDHEFGDQLGDTSDAHMQSSLETSTKEHKLGIIEL